MSPANIAEISRRLREKYPGAKYALDWTTPLEMLVATILAARATDAKVNEVTKKLFKKYPDVQAYAAAKQEELEVDLKATGFFRQKAKTVRDVANALIERFGGEVPRTMEEMVTLPGVGRKTANVVLVTAFGIPSGVIVDTHVERLAGRIGLSKEDGAEKIEADLMRLVPKEDWTWWAPAVILHGRYTCTAKKPKCESCEIAELCPKIGV